MRPKFLLPLLLLPGLLCAQPTKPAKKPAAPPAFDARQRPGHLTDEQLLDLVQRQTFRYF